MTLDEPKPIVEGMLYTYGLYRRQNPAPPISAVYHQAAAPLPKPLPPRSPVERYVPRHEDEIRLKGVLNQLAPLERQLVEWRYFERMQWEQMTRRTKMIRVSLSSKLERTLYAIAAWPGMLRDKAEPNAEAGSVTAGG